MATQKYKNDPETQRALHLKWEEFDHIVREVSTAMNTAHYPYVAKSGTITPKMQMAIERFVGWAQRHYGQEA